MIEVDHDNIILSYCFH